MNAAARLVTHNIISKPWQLAFSLKLTFAQWVLLIMSLVLLGSGLGTIYLAHFNRLLHSSYQSQILEYDELQTKRGQLLLERSNWLTQTRIQQLAENKLGMIMPQHAEFIILR